MDKENEFKLGLAQLYSEINLDILLNKITKKIQYHLNCEESSIFLYDSLKEELHFETATGEKQDELKKIVLKKGEGIVGWIAENKKSLIINDCSKDSRFTAKTDLKTNFTTRSIVGIPVIMDNKFLGVLEAINRIDGKFKNEDIKMLEYISNFISIPLQNAILFKKVTQETKEKDRLIELGKIISSSFSLDEVFKALKVAISEIIDPLEINVMVHSQGMLYRLIESEKVLIRRDDPNETSITNKHAVFPLRTKNRILGSLELKLENKIPDEVISFIRGLAVFAAISIEKFELASQMIEKEKIEKELQIAKEIQQSFLIGEKITLKGIEVSYINIPSSEVGGDYYDVININKDKTIFTINDVSGHGVPASLLMSIVRANFVYRVKKDRDILTTINNLNNLIAETTDSNLFVTSFTCLIDRANLRLSYINAGHISPFIVRGRRIVELKEASLVLGIFPDILYSLVEEKLLKDDIIVLFTDGVIEAENRRGEQFSYEKFKRFVRSNKHLDVESIKEKFITGLKKYIDKDYFDDDITFIIIKIK